MFSNCLVLIVWLSLFDTFIICKTFSDIDLPWPHASIYFNNYGTVKNQCLQDAECLYRDLLTSNQYNIHACWGYERWCKDENKYSSPSCQKTLNAWVDQMDIFYKQADFGYVKKQINEMMVLCEPNYSFDSSLECSSLLHFCRGRNLMINFTELSMVKEPIRYNIDVLKHGEIGGHCKFFRDRLQAQTEHMGALQSWAPELRFFEPLPDPIISSGKCNIVIDKPVFVMKIDAASNMYHHFCDFFNLYASLHVNSSHPSAFGTDVHILIWESYTYESPFSDVFEAFTRNEIWDLKTFRGQIVCFKNIVLPLLPRMIFGLYYNTPIIHGCENSGLFQAFSEHVLHRLKIPLVSRKKGIIRVTFLSRKTKYRQVLNEDELLDEINSNETYFVRRVSFERGVSFKEQLHIIRNTDILIGIHGAGLTHLLFLPNWATIFELYNCEDPKCYKDLARLRGINYMTWQDDSKLIRQDDKSYSKNGAHAKFANYIFDRKEFAVLLAGAARNILENENYKGLFSKETSVRDEL